MVVGCTRQPQGAPHKQTEFARVSGQDTATGGFSSTRALGAEDNNIARQHPEVSPRVTGIFLAKQPLLQPRVEIKSLTAKHNYYLVNAPVEPKSLGE